MKKTIVLMTALIALFVLFGCTQQQTATPENVLPQTEEQPKVEEQPTTPEVPETPIPPEVTGKLECTFDLTNITKVQSQYGMQVVKYWQFPVTIKNNSGNEAKNIVITFTPIGEEAFAKTYVIESIAAGETITEVLKYSVRNIAWVNPKISVTAENVEVSESCQIPEVQGPPA